MNITTEINEILEKIKKDTPNIIGIDGNDGVGKTSLAKEIEKFGYKRISLDDLLKKKSGGYYKFIDYETLKSIVKHPANKLTVIEGVLLQKILNKISLTLDYSIYITDNVWVYDWLEEYQGKYYNLPLVDIIKNEEQYINHINQALVPRSKPYQIKGLRREIYKYSYKYRPWDNVDVVLCID